jgi:hypothetical protein
VRWLELVNSGSERDAVKQMLRGVRKGKRPIGRPRMRGTDEMTKIVRKMEVDIEQRRWSYIVGDVKHYLR